jgi:hypothetical protein
MTHRSTARARVRIELGSIRPFDASIEMRVQCWLRRVARAIERRDTPLDPIARSQQPERADPPG